MNHMVIQILILILSLDSGLYVWQTSAAHRPLTPVVHAAEVKTEAPGSKLRATMFNSLRSHMVILFYADNMGLGL